MSDVGTLSQHRDKYVGGCLCGAVRYGFYGPLLAQLACHCRTCQYETGGGPAYRVAVRRDQFRITRGDPRGYLVLSGAGDPVTRYFCAECGTPLYSANDTTADRYGILVGSLDEAIALRPRHQWLADAPRWHPRRWFRRGAWEQHRPAAPAPSPTASADGSDSTDSGR